MIRQTLRFQPFNLSTMDFPSWVEMMRYDTALSTFQPFNLSTSQPFNLSTIGNCDTAPQEELESVRRVWAGDGSRGGLCTLAARCS